MMILNKRERAKSIIVDAVKIMTTMTSSYGRTALTSLKFNVNGDTKSVTAAITISEPKIHKRFVLV